MDQGSVEGAMGGASDKELLTPANFDDGNEKSSSLFDDVDLPDCSEAIDSFSQQLPLTPSPLAKKWQLI